MDHNTKTGNLSGKMHFPITKSKTLYSTGHCLSKCSHIREIHNATRFLCKCQSLLVCGWYKGWGCLGRLSSNNITDHKCSSMFALIINIFKSVLRIKKCKSCILHNNIKKVVSLKQTVSANLSTLKCYINRFKKENTVI